MFELYKWLIVVFVVVFIVFVFMLYLVCKGNGMGVVMYWIDVCGMFVWLFGNWCFVVGVVV